MSKNIFQKIIDKEISADILFEDDYVIAFKDINPVADVHILIVPKKLYINVDDVPDSDMIVFSQIICAAKKIAADIGVSGAYKLITNVGAKAGQSVFHMHFHLMSGNFKSGREF